MQALGNHKKRKAEKNGWLHTSFLVDVLPEK
jgi:hypothetical protein